MSKKTMGLVAIIAGLILVILSITADLVGIGAKPGFGWHQALGVIAGVLMIAGGAWVTRKKTGSPK